MFKYLIAFIFFLITPLSQANPVEILQHHSDILVHRDNSLEITKTLRISTPQKLALNQSGLLTLSKKQIDHNKKTQHYQLTISRVTLDGKAMSFKIRRLSQALNILLSKKTIPAGIHEIQITYRTSPIIESGDIDTLYWELLNPVFNYPVKQASFIINTQGITQFSMAKLNLFSSNRTLSLKPRQIAPNRFTYRLENIPASQGLALELAWPHRSVKPINAFTKLAMVHDSEVYLVGLMLNLGLVLVLELIAYLALWRRQWQSDSKQNLLNSSLINVLLTGVFSLGMLLVFSVGDVLLFNGLRSILTFMAKPILSNIRDILSYLITALITLALYLVFAEAASNAEVLEAVNGLKLAFALALLMALIGDIPRLTRRFSAL